MALRIALVLLLGSFVSSARNCPSFVEVGAHISNLTGISQSVSVAAQKEAQWLLKSLCVEIHWSDDPSDEVLQIQLLPKPLVPINGDCLGLALVTGGRKSHAAAFVSRIGETNREEQLVSLPNFLGCVIAHEIGHLLLRTSGHSDRGLMSARLGRQQLLAAKQRRLLFTNSDRKLMASRVEHGS